MVGMRKGYKILVGKTEGKCPLGIPKSRRKDNIRMDLKYVERVWIHLAQDRIPWRTFV
jgi:hypothetical protein